MTSWKDVKAAAREFPVPDAQALATGLREYARRIETEGPEALDDFALFADAFARSFLMARVMALSKERK